MIPYWGSKIIRTVCLSAVLAIWAGLAPQGLYCAEKGGTKPAASSAEQVAAWIKQLGDEDPQVREGAQRQLQAAMPAVQAALEAATKSNDAEVASRARAILKNHAEGEARKGLQAEVSIKEAGVRVVLAKDGSVCGYGLADGRIYWKCSLPIGQPPLGLKPAGSCVRVVFADGSWQEMDARVGKVLQIGRDRQPGP